MELPEPLPAEPKFRLYQSLPTRWDEVLQYVDSESGDLLKKAFGEEPCRVNLKVRGYDIEHYFKLSLIDEIKELTIRY